jgi:hypothetical protein
MAVATTTRGGTGTKRSKTSNGTPRRTASMKAAGLPAIRIAEGQIYMGLDFQGTVAWPLKPAQCRQLAQSLLEQADRQEARPRGK